MKITMLENRRGSEDTHTVTRFYKGESYEVADTLASSFIRQGRAVEDSLFETVKEIVTAFDAKR